MVFTCYLDLFTEKYALSMHPCLFKCSDVAHTIGQSEKHSRGHCGQDSGLCRFCFYNTKKKSIGFPSLVMKLLGKNVSLFKQLKKTFLSVTVVRFPLLSFREPGTQGSAPRNSKVIRRPMQIWEQPSTLIPWLTPCIFPSPQPSCFLHFLKLLYIYSSSSLPCNKRMGKNLIKIISKRKRWSRAGNSCNLHTIT